MKPIVDLEKLIFSDTGVISPTEDLFDITGMEELEAISGGHNIGCPIEINVPCGGSMLM